MKFRKVMWYSHQQEAFALPAALFLLLVLSAAGVVISTAANNSLQEIVVDNTRQETFLVSEGAANQIFGDMSSAPETWRSMTPLSDLPADYTEYSPQSYSSSNGIPTCSGVACHRDLFPTGGGLLKNFGPTGGDGDVVDTSFPITEQLNPDDLPEADVTLNSMQSWTQVERLDESTPGSDSVGGSLDDSTAGGGGASTVRFRVTAKTRSAVKGRTGESTIVYIVEIPPT